MQVLAPAAARSLLLHPCHKPVYTYHIVATAQQVCAYSRQPCYTPRESPSTSTLLRFDSLARSSTRPHPLPAPPSHRIPRLTRPLPPVIPPALTTLSQTRPWPLPLPPPTTMARSLPSAASAHPRPQPAPPPPPPRPLPPHPLPHPCPCRCCPGTLVAAAASRTSPGRRHPLHLLPPPPRPGARCFRWQGCPPCRSRCRPWPRTACSRPATACGATCLRWRRVPGRCRRGGWRTTCRRRPGRTPRGPAGRKGVAISYWSKIIASYRGRITLNLCPGRTPRGPGRGKELWGTESGVTETVHIILCAGSRLNASGACGEERCCDGLWSLTLASGSHLHT